MRGVVFHWLVVAVQGSFAGYAGYSIFGIVVVVQLQHRIYFLGAVG